MTPKYQVFGPDAEVYGPAMLAFAQSINFGNFQDLLHQHGLAEVRDEWYPQQMWLDVFNQVGSMEDLVSIGMKIIDTAVMPPQLLEMPFEEFMQHFDENYRANNRGQDIGGIECIVAGENHIIMVDKTPYPDEFVYGAYYSLARRFLKGHQFTVSYDQNIPRRSKGGTETRVHITWK